MAYGVVNQSLASLRKEPFERSEMVSQLLFGETFSVIEEHKEWLRIQNSFDSYEGWLDRKVCILIDQEEYDLLSLSGITSIATRLFCAMAKSNGHGIRLCPGSNLYNYDSQNGTFKLINEEYKTFNVPFDDFNDSKPKMLVELANTFVNSPYLWGGRSPYGIDCSGLTQVLYKMVNIAIPRDASQQALVGTTVDFMNMAQPGDLAFFDDEEGNIIHVGMVMPENKIIHSSGYVKVDLIDHQGIFSVNTNGYSHKLRVVKRIL